MGKRHRANRKVIKLYARRFGMRETELGEIKRHISKAEARRRFVVRHRMEYDIMQVAVARATADIQAEEDARFLQMLEQGHAHSVSDHASAE